MQKTESPRGSTFLLDFIYEYAKYYLFVNILSIVY